MGEGEKGTDIERRRLLGEGLLTLPSPPAKLKPNLTLTSKFKD